MEFRRNEGRNRWTVADADTGNVATENAVLPVIDMMMARVTGRGDGLHFVRRNADYFHVLHDPDPLGRNRRDLAPKFLHIVAESARGGLDQFGSIDKVRRTAWMDINCRPKLGKTPRCAGVIEMNVTEEDMANIFGCEVSLPKIGNYIVESRFRAGIEKRDAVVGLDRSRSNNAGPSELTRVENVQHTENTRERGPRG